MTKNVSKLVSFVNQVTTDNAITSGKLGDLTALPTGLHVSKEERLGLAWLPFLSNTGTLQWCQPRPKDTSTGQIALQIAEADHDA